MLDNLSRYVYEVYRCKSVSDAAKKLYLSQPALSTSIRKAEKTLGTPIFNRNTVPFSLTPAGKVYIEAIEKILYIETEAKNTIADIREMRGGTLTIGTHSHLASSLIPVLCKKFLQQHPNIDIHLAFHDSPTLLTMLKEATIDLMFTYDECVRDDMQATTLFLENCVIAVTKDNPVISALQPYALTHSQLIQRSYSDTQRIENLTVFDGIAFINCGPDATLYKTRKHFFGDACLPPHVVTNSRNFTVNYNLMCAGLGALFTTDGAVATMPPTDNCLFFVLKDPLAVRRFVIARPANQEETGKHITDTFIALTQQYLSLQNPLQILAQISSR